MIPDWWQFILLALASYRLWRLLADDDITDRPRRWALNLGREWQPGDDAPDGYRERWGLFLTCPWCAGAWISGLVYLTWVLLLGNPDHASDVLVGIGVWFALSAAVGLIRGNLDQSEG